VILLVPIVILVALAIGAIALRNALGEDSPSWLRGTTIAIGLAFLFFVLSGLGMLGLIIGLVTANVPVLIAAVVMFVLAFATPVVVWLMVRPKLQRLREQERARAAVARAEFEAGASERRAEAERLRRERLRIAAEAAERARLEYGAAYVGQGGLDPEGAGAPVYYEILGLEVHAGAEEIEDSYRREIRAHHPDRGGESRRAQLINEAYETLRDPSRRARYDRENGIR
jgi:DnaJ-domain-containing protein 1